MEFNNSAPKIQNRSVTATKRSPMDYYFEDGVFLLRKITPIKEYVDHSFTDKILGYTYECVDTYDFRHVKVKIEGQKKPLMTNEALQEMRQAERKVAVEFINGTVLPYVCERTHSIEDSYKADDVRLITED